MRKFISFKNIIFSVVMFVFVINTGIALGADKVVSFGQDLTASQRDVMASYFGFVDAKSINVPVVTVNNQEERAYLKGLVPERVIGTKAISSAFVELLGPGKGIHVTTENITWVSEEMFTNALITAQVKDAEIKAGSPFPVSGTAALTGIIKAFEKATGQNISDKIKKVANEELVRMGQISESIKDKDKAAALFLRVKEEIVRRNITDPEGQKQIIISVANDLNINLTDLQINQIVELMQKISSLNLNINDITSQLTSISQKLNQLFTKGEEVKGWLQVIIDTIKDFINRIINVFM